MAILGDTRATSLTVSNTATLASLNANSTGLGLNGQFLKSNGTTILWATLSKSDIGLGNVANKTITVTSTSVSDGTNTFNKYTHPTTSGNKHIPSGGSSGQFLGWNSDGTAKWVANPNANYYHKTGSWSGLTYTAAKVGSPDDLAFTIPTGATSTTVAVGNHTHTTTLTSGGTATVNLAANTAYTLTAGGTSVIFKTPADGNTDTKVNVVARGTTKTYLLGDTTAPTSNAAAHTAVAETGIYMTTTAGQINATTYKVNEAVTLQYTTATKSLDFIFA